MTTKNKMAHHCFWLFFVLFTFLPILPISPLFAANTGSAGSVSVPKKGTVTASALHFRASPTINSKSLGTNTKGTTLTIYAQKNGWYKINESPVSWSSGNYIRVTDWGEEDIPIKPKDPDSKVHEKVWSTLKTPNIPLLRKVGNNLSRGNGK